MAGRSPESALMEQAIERARRVAAAIAGMAGLVAVSLGGSVGAGLADAASDLDLHVYWRGVLSQDEERAALLEQVADPGSVEVGIHFWGLEDHLYVDGQLVELVYVNLDELGADIACAYGPGIGGEGCVTAQFFYVTNSVLVHDPSGEIQALRERQLAGYPEPTRQLVLRDNPLLMRFYLKHLRQAQSRNDLLFVQHRRYTVQMVFFNLLFALNRQYHPGEKRLTTHGERCPMHPCNLAIRWTQMARLPADDPALGDQLEALIDELSELANEEMDSPQRHKEHKG